MGFVAKMGFTGLWLGLLAAQGSCALLMVFVLCRTDWIVQVERARELTKNSNNTTTPPSPISLTPQSDHNIKEENKTGSHDHVEEVVLRINEEIVKPVASLETDPLISDTLNNNKH